MFKRLRESLATSREALSAEISSSLFETLDTETWERLEEALIMADVGARTTADVVGRLEAEVESGKVEGAEAARARLIELLAETAVVGDPRINLTKKPAVVLVVGVNGTGKTTTIGKLAHVLSSMGLKVVLAAGDTYRAAAVEQLTTWAERSGVEIVRAETGQDAGRRDLRRDRRGRGARRRRRPRRHRRAPAHPHRPDGGARQGQPRDHARSSGRARPRR